MVRFSGLIAIAALAVLGAFAPALAEKRVALVIGNDRYASLSASEQLQKAVNDARAVGGALRQIGFEVVSGENVGRQALIDRLDETARRVQPGDTVFFFFSGHGVTVEGANYILPADVPMVGTGQITRLTGAAVREDDITAAFIRAGARVAVVVLDACRNNPFASLGTRGIGGERGLAPREPPSGVFTFYSAGRGEAALDRLYDGDGNPNSVFTRVLVPALGRPDLDLSGLAIEVREEVTRLARSVKHDQRPAYYDETSGGRIYLAAGNLAAGTPAAAPRPDPSGGKPGGLAAAGMAPPPGVVQSPPPGPIPGSPVLGGVAPPAKITPSPPPAVAAPAGAQQAAIAAPAALSKATLIQDATALRRLKNNHGIALQWIWDNPRGRLNVTESNGVIHLEGSQVQRNGAGRLTLSGDVVSIDQSNMTFNGTINMYDAPSDRKECLRNGVFTFRITGSRQYWRLQQMEACDGLTDYVDIYF
jgi:hypothetical protein